MIAVLSILAPIFALIGLGLWLRRSGRAPEEHWRTVEQICYLLFFPALLISTLMDADLGGGAVSDMALTMVATVVPIGGLVLALRGVLYRYWGVEAPAFTSIFQACTRWNGFVALAIVIELYGVEGGALVAVAFAVMVPLINITNVVLLASLLTDGRPDPIKILQTLAKNPFIIGCTVGLAINLLNVSVPHSVETLLDLTGRAALGLGLLAVGAGLRVRYALKPSREIWLTVALKMILWPLIAGLAAYAFGMTGAAFEIAVICVAVPTAMNGFILARRMGGDAELYAGAVTVQTAVAALSIPLVVLLVRALGV